MLRAPRPLTIAESATGGVAADAPCGAGAAEATAATQVPAQSAANLET
jgi:hypothetical protein